MKVSRHWLTKFFDAPLPDAEALAQALTFHAFEIDGVEKYGDDSVLDVKVTPNRGHDCLSHRGIAKELSAILKLPLAHDPLQAAGDTDFAASPRSPAAEKSVSPAASVPVSVTLEDPALSPRYIAGYIRGVKVGESPAWLKRNLESIGQRSINNVVDATNFVMFNLGQPLHAFDAAKLQRNIKDGPLWHIVVRKARAGEKILALDNKEYELKDSMLVIADGNADVPVGIAGIKGGTPAAITDATTDIIIESANFNSVSVRKTAQALKLRTDASSRFEQSLSPELAGHGMRAVIELIQKIAGGELVGVADVYPAPQEPARASVSIEKVNHVLGTQLTGADVSDVLLRLGFAYKEEGGVFNVEVPLERLDITTPEDLVEEVGRIIGYDKVPAIPLPPLNTPQGVPAVNENFFAAERTRADLMAQGYSEVFTSVFAEAGERAVLNKADSVKPYLRATLIDGLTEALKKNLPNKDLLGIKELKLFEIGTVWSKSGERVMVGTVSEKQPAREHALESAQAAAAYDELPLSDALRYKPFSRYPYIVRDVAAWVPSTFNIPDVNDIIKKAAGALATTVVLFDQFQKGDKTSLAFRLIFQSFERTLTEVEANEIMERVYAALTEKGFEIR